MPHHSDDQLKAMGFEVDRSGGDDVYKDVFGETHSIPTYVDIEANGVKFSTTY
jgi:hypothetical protein